MKLAVLSLVAGSAAAFTPAQSGKAATTLNINELQLGGATEPLSVFDPLGWMDSKPESFKCRRAVERKHRRIAMMAVVGCITHNNHIVFNGYLSPSNSLKFSDVSTGIEGIFTVPSARLATNCGKTMSVKVHE